VVSYHSPLWGESIGRRPIGGGDSPSRGNRAAYRTHTDSSGYTTWRNHLLTGRYDIQDVLA